MKNKKTILAIGAGLLFLALVFAWLFLGADVPEPTNSANKANDSTVKAAVYNTVLNREVNGKRLWELKVGEAQQVDKNLIRAKKLDGILYLDNGDEMHVKADAAEIRMQTNDFALTEGVTARLKGGGFLKADSIAWQQKEDILTATGAVKVIKDDMLARAEKIITSSKLEHFKMQGKAHVERGGQYEEN